MHWKTLPFFPFLLLLTSKTSANPTVCQPDELGIGLLYTFAEEPNLFGIIYSHTCELQDRSSAPNWWEVGWKKGTQVINGPIHRGYAGPTEVQYSGRTYNRCYAASGNSACLRQNKPGANYDIVPYCCGETPAEGEDDWDPTSSRGEGTDEKGQKQVWGIEDEGERPIGDDWSSYFDGVDSENW